MMHHRWIVQEILQERFGDFRVIHLRHTRWSRARILGKVFNILSKDADNEYAMIDSKFVIAHQNSSRDKKKPQSERKSSNRKIVRWTKHKNSFYN